jgi:hypothetical protein
MRLAAQIDLEALLETNIGQRGRSDSRSVRTAGAFWKLVEWLVAEIWGREESWRERRPGAVGVLDVFTSL